MTRNIRKPDFFIVGAPKCGTTAMYEYLKQHPEIFMAPKEIHFFGSDLEWPGRPLSKEQYLSYFSKAKDGQKLGEASVWYLYSKKAAFEIKEFSPWAKIIIMLRNPVDMLYSLHSQLLYNGEENIIDFKEALDAEKERKKGKQLPPKCSCYQFLYYRDVAKYTEQVRRYFDVFGRENVHIIIFDDFKKDTAKVYKETLRFLGVDDNFMPEFKVVNPNKVVRSQALRDFLRSPPPLVRKLGRALIPKPLRQQIMKGLRRINTKYIPRPPMDPELRRQLQEEFRPEVERLSKLLGRDLTFWVKEHES